MKEKDEVIKENEKVIWIKDESLREKDGVIREKSVTIRAQQSEIQRLRDQLEVRQQVSSHTTYQADACSQHRGGQPKQVKCANGMQLSVMDCIAYIVDVETD